MSRPWFDEDSSIVLLDDYVTERESYKQITADGQISSAELQEQTQVVVDLLKRLESMLPPEAREVATDALCELAVLHVLRARAQSGQDGVR